MPQSLETKDRRRNSRLHTEQDDQRVSQVVTNGRHPILAGSLASD